MLIPWGTDAPIYHWPVATVGLIVANTAAFFATMNLDPETQASLAMRLGDGIHPLEWFTSIFCHANIQHLVGNMMFLWAFGIVVEGKLGWLRFLVVYLGIGVGESALEQLLFRTGTPGFSVGASAAIYGLLAVCMVWAPRNELHCLSFFQFRIANWDLPILLFAVLYIGIEVFMTAISAGQIFSALAHSTGALVGFLVGVAMLKGGVVDCENWDLFTVMRGEHIQPIGGRRSLAKFAPSPSERKAKAKKPKRRKVSSEEDLQMEDPASAATRSLRLGLENGEVEASLAAYRRGMRKVPGWSPSESDLRELIKLLIAAKNWRPAIEVMEAYLQQVESPRPAIRLTLAQVLAYEVERPAHALRVLSETPESSLPPSLQPTHRKVVRKAEAMREEGDLEREGDTA